MMLVHVCVCVCVRERERKKKYQIPQDDIRYICPKGRIKTSRDSFVLVLLNFDSGGGDGGIQCDVSAASCKGQLNSQ
jgi:hypothetical protein